MRAPPSCAPGNSLSLVCISYHFSPTVHPSISHLLSIIHSPIHAFIHSFPIPFLNWKIPASWGVQNPVNTTVALGMSGLGTDPPRAPGFPSRKTRTHSLNYIMTRWGAQTLTTCRSGEAVLAKPQGAARALCPAALGRGPETPENTEGPSQAPPTIVPRCGNRGIVFASACCYHAGCSQACHRGQGAVQIQWGMCSFSVHTISNQILSYSFFIDSF